jgi:hypothetical protein
MDFEEIAWGGMDWIDLAQDRVKWRDLNNKHSGSIKCWEVLEWLHLPKRAQLNGVI